MYTSKRIHNWSDASASTKGPDPDVEAIVTLSDYDAK